MTKYMILPSFIVTSLFVLVFALAATLSDPSA